MWAPTADLVNRPTQADVVSGGAVGLIDMLNPRALRGLAGCVPHAGSQRSQSSPDFKESLARDPAVMLTILADRGRHGQNIAVESVLRKMLRISGVSRV